MNKLFFHITLCLWLLSGIELPAQSLRFKTVLDNPNSFIVNMKQDKLGFFWLLNTGSRLQKFDGVKLQSFLHDPDNTNSIAPGEIVSFIIDADNNLWLGIYGSGLDRLDPATNTITHFRHNAKDAYSLSDDAVNAVLEDHAGNLWIGTNKGLDLLDKKTGRFTHFSNNNAPEGFRIYEDRKGILWIYGGSSAKDHKSPSALNRFDPTTKKFTPYFQDSTKANNGIPGAWLRDIYEDNKNNFWLVTDAGLYTMDRNTGNCTRHYPDPFNSSTLSQTSVAEDAVSNISFVTEDSSGAFWVGMSELGLNRYDPITKTSMHFGLIYDFTDVSASSKRDTATGLNITLALKGISSNDGLFWVIGLGGIAQLNYNKTTFPFYKTSKAALALYQEPNGKILWIGTDKGLLKKDLATQKEKLLIVNPKDNKTTGKYIFSIVPDEEGNLWLGTGAGLVKFDPVTEKYIHYKYDPSKPESISSNKINYLLFDYNKNLWIASDSGISRMDRTTGQFTNYNARQIGDDIKGFEVNRIAEDPEHNIWFTANWGLYKLDIKTGKFTKHINDDLRSICIDTEGRIWTGGWLGLYAFNETKDKFELFANENSEVNISGVLNVTEDDQKNLWVSATTAIFKINEDRTKVTKYTDDNGVQFTQSLWSFSSFKATDGRLFLGNYFGYYSFRPDKLIDNNTSPPLNITSFKLGDELITSDNGDLLSLPIWQTEEIKLRYDQNVFSFDFFSADYTASTEKKYSYMLENYDNIWHTIGSEHQASFFNIPPGNYTFKAKAISGDGRTAEKSIRIIISPPWWKTWWAYNLFALLIIISGYLVYKYQKYYIVKKERERTQKKELAQAKEIEKAYTELKATQAQLIQSEKMASLGELTAGIAHEIQNPLNFVNNFSDVNIELIEEMKKELAVGNRQLAEEIAEDIKSNEQKINHHGKRADAIVKGMLQHSRTSSGQKELTDINALADEYLRLAYHGLRAKDKSFNARFETHLDPTLPKVNVVPQDIGRVLLNLINNAFYACTERSRSAVTLRHSKGDNSYQPTVWVSTQNLGDKIEIRVKDNGNGIPDSIKEKIFQPFFTTKPTGQGTGLGLSLSYDIVKAHGGELIVKSSEGNGSEFTVHLYTA